MLCLRALSGKITTISLPEFNMGRAYEAEFASTYGPNDARPTALKVRR